MKFIIFDIDGTLTNTKKVDDQCFISAFEVTFGIDIKNQKWEEFKHVTDWGITEEIMQRTWGRKPSKEEYELMISNHVSQLEAERKRDISQFSQVDGAKAFFTLLEESSEIKLGVATGAWERSALLKPESIGISLDGICFSNSDHHKSREAITKNVIDQLALRNPGTPEKIVYFGDGVWDYNTCRNLGIEFIGIDFENNGKLRNIGAKTIFRDYSKSEQILNVLK